MIASIYCISYLSLGSTVGLTLGAAGAGLIIGTLLQTHKGLALWGMWLEETLLADVPHRQVVLTVPKRLRPYFLYDRKLLGELSRVAARMVTSFFRATVGEKDLSAPSPITLTSLQDLPLAVRLPTPWSS